MTLTGKFIVFEGIDNCGKSTQSKLAKEYLETEGHPVIHSYEPGGTQTGQIVRSWVKDIKHEGIISPRGELDLFNIARRHIVDDVVLPALSQGAHVLLDRYFYSTLAYQGSRMTDGKPELEEGLIWTQCLNASRNLTPDLVLLFDRDPQEALASIKGRQKDRFEQSLEYMARVRRRYLQMAQRQENFRVISYVKGDPHAMFEQVKDCIDGLL